MPGDTATSDACLSSSSSKGEEGNQAGYNASGDIDSSGEFDAKAPKPVARRWSPIGNWLRLLVQLVEGEVEVQDIYSGLA